MQHVPTAKSIRGRQSPLLTLDSPFPPLKSELRYKGVYERAGFDVNLGYRSPSDDRSLFLKQLSTPPAAAGYDHGHLHRHPASSDSHVSSNTSLSSSQENKAPLAFGEAQQEHRVPLRPVGSQARAQSPSNSAASSRYFELHTPLPNGPNRPVVKRFQPETINPRMRPAHDPLDEAQGEQNDRNKKNLKLHLSEGELSMHTATEVSADTDLPFDNSRASGVSTPSTSASSSQYFVGKAGTPSPISVNTSEILRHASSPAHGPSAKAGRDLDYSLEGLAQDVNRHKAYDPRGTPASGPVNVLAPPGQFVPATGDLTASFHGPEAGGDHRVWGSGQEKPSRDYEDFLLISATGEKPHARMSRFSTISSIISKQPESSVGRNSDEEDDEDEEEDEVAMELQRQLEQIKTGSQISLVAEKQSQDSFVTAPGSFGQTAMPTIRVSQDSGLSSEEESWAGSDGRIGTESSIHDGTQAASIGRSADRRTQENRFDREARRPEDGHGPPPEISPEGPTAGEPYTPRTKHAFDSEPFLETPETIKPLSPKTHSVEQELEDLNFTCASANEGEAALMPAPVGAPSDIDILGQNPTPREFDAFPKSVVDPKFPVFRNSEAAPKVAPGTGPCRGCGETIAAGARGPQKAVYSRAGDLSGQWHRGCFACSYADCSVAFTKDVAPYVLLDHAFCHHHYHALNNTLCETCHRGIEGECIENELKQKWHPACLTCSRCHAAISADYFVVNHQVVCEADARAYLAGLADTGLHTLDKVEKRRTRMLFID